MAEDLVSVPQFYSGKRIFITGATGFIGKVLIWKLLHDCPLLDKIYILLRQKKSISTEQRRIDLLKCRIFDTFRETGRTQLLDKIVALSGDVTYEDLGLNNDDKRCLVEEVDLVFYSAALLNMDASLKKAIQVNVEGVLRTLKILEGNKRLDAFLYVSTAYSCCNEAEVHEEFYPMSMDPHDILRLVHSLRSSALDKITPDIINPLPNSYTFSKRVTEALLAKYEKQFLIIIARPTIVICSYKDPIPGWCDNLNGPVGISVATGKGILRVMHVDPHKKADLMPVDTVVNSLLVISWREAQRKEKLSAIPIYNIAAREKSVTWREYQIVLAKAAIKYPFELILWYPNYNILEPNKLVYQIKNVFYHKVPAIVIDFLLLLFRQKRFMMRSQKKIASGMKVLTYFSTKEWTFNTDNMNAIEKLMNEEDKETFPISAIDYYITNFAEVATLAVKKNFFNESVDDIFKCRLRLKILYIIHIATKVLFLYFISILFLKFINLF